MTYNKLNRPRNLMSYRAKRKSDSTCTKPIRIVQQIGYNKLSVLAPCNRLLRYVKGTSALRIAPWNNPITRMFMRLKAILSYRCKREAIPYNYIYFKLLNK